MDAGLIQNWPVIPPPPGVKSNFVDPPTLTTPLIGITASLVPLMLVVVAVRLFTRAYVTRALGWDDFFIVLSTLGTLSNSILMMLNFPLGSSRHLWDIRAVDFTPARIHQIAGVANHYPIIILTLKLSILICYLRLFGVNRSFRVLVYWTIAVQVVIYTLYLGNDIAITIVCSNYTQVFAPLCQSTPPVVVAQGAFNVVSDFWMLLMPVREVLRLQLPRQKQLGLIAIFVSGGLACLATLGRLIYSATAINDHDTLWYSCITAGMAMFEIVLGIIAACLSVLPAFTHWVASTRFCSLLSHPATTTRKWLSLHTANTAPSPKPSISMSSHDSSIDTRGARSAFFQSLSKGSAKVTTRCERGEMTEWPAARAAEPGSLSSRWHAMSRAQSPPAAARPAVVRHVSASRGFNFGDLELAPEVPERNPLRGQSMASQDLEGGLAGILRTVDYSVNYPPRRSSRDSWAPS